MTTPRTFDVHRPPRGRRGAVRGVTLFELVAVMAIVGILMSVAIPSYNYVTSSNRIAGEINGLLGDLQFARSEAIKEGQPVTVCVSSNGVSCSINTTLWQAGWLVWADLNGNGAIDAGEVMRIQTPLTGSDTLIASSNALSSITFSREGFAVGMPPAALVTLHAATPNSASTRCLSITIIGQMSVQSAGTTANGSTCQ